MLPLTGLGTWNVFTDTAQETRGPRARCRQVWLLPRTFSPLLADGALPWVLHGFSSVCVSTLVSLCASKFLLMRSPVGFDDSLF